MSPRTPLALALALGLFACRGESRPERPAPTPTAPDAPPRPPGARAVHPDP
ncbi:MAG: hypothetical protein R3F65_32810 [bacterium]